MQSLTNQQQVQNKMTEGHPSPPSTTNSAMAPMVDIPDEKDPRFAVLSYEQVKRLNDLMSEVLQIDGRGNFPTIEVKLRDLVSVVRRRLVEDHGVKVKEVRLNGSGASSVLAADFPDDGCSNGNPYNYNDLDLIFSVDLATGRDYDRVKCAVLESLMQLLPEEVSRKRMSSCSMKEAYVSKMVKVNDNQDRWSLITLGGNVSSSGGGRSKSVELKFVHTMRRQYEFSVDSFHVLLDTLFLFYDCANSMPISENFYPTVVGESMYGDFGEALYHLSKKLIATRAPEEIRGGGLLKYCNLLCKRYRPAWTEEVKSMERYMCSRFFIDFAEIAKQQAKLENYLYNHFQDAEDRHKYEYLMILYHVVDESTVCLMGHERRLTLALIEDLAYSVYPDGFSDYASTSSSSASSEADPNLLSPMSMSDACSTISSASSVSSSGYTTPQKPETPSPLQQQQQHVPTANLHQPPPPVLTANATTATTVQQQHSNGTSTATVITTTGHHAVNTAVPPPSAAPAAPVATPQSMIPTYEIVTSCQPAVVYSNGYYYTSFMQGAPVNTTSPTLQVSTLTATGPCLACSCNSSQQQQQQQWQSVPPVSSSSKKNNKNHRQQQQRHHHQNKQQQHHHMLQQQQQHKLISS